VLNKAQHALANIPRRWMIEQTVRSGAQILFEYDASAR